MKRLNSVLKSKLLTHLSESIQGVKVIRAFNKCKIKKINKKEKWFTDQFIEKLTNS